MWEMFRVSSDKLALCHLELSKKLHDLIKEINRYGEEQVKVHKKVGFGIQKCCQTLDGFYRGFIKVELNSKSEKHCTLFFFYLEFFLNNSNALPGMRVWLQPFSCISEVWALRHCCLLLLVSGDVEWDLEISVLWSFLPSYSPYWRLWHKEAKLCPLIMVLTALGHIIQCTTSPDH